MYDLPPRPSIAHCTTRRPVDESELLLRSTCCADPSHFLSLNRYVKTVPLTPLFTIHERKFIGEGESPATDRGWRVRNWDRRKEVRRPNRRRNNMPAMAMDRHRLGARCRRHAVQYGATMAPFGRRAARCSDQARYAFAETAHSFKATRLL